MVWAPQSQARNSTAITVRGSQKQDNFDCNHGFSHPRHVPTEKLAKAGMELKTGVDLVEIERLEQTIERYGERFLQRIFTDKEVAEVGSNTASLAARFAAKEAVAKALGTGIGVISWHEIEIQRGPAREPRLHLSGKASSLAAALGLHTWSISLSHTRTHAIAVAVALGNLEKPDTTA